LASRLHVVVLEGVILQQNANLGGELEDMQAHRLGHSSTRICTTHTQKPKKHISMSTQSPLTFPIRSMPRTLDDGAVERSQHPVSSRAKELDDHLSSSG